MSLLFSFPTRRFSRLLPALLAGCVWTVFLSAGEGHGQIIPLDAPHLAALYGVSETSAPEAVQATPTPSVPGNATDGAASKEVEGVATTLEEEVRRLRARLDALEQDKKSDTETKDNQAKSSESKDKGSEKPAEKKEEKKDDKKPTDGWTDVSTEKWTVKLGGHVQADYVNWAKADRAINSAQDYFEFRRLRLVADGTGYGLFDFRLQMTLEPETVGESNGAATSPDVKDAYLSMNEIPLLGRMRIGNFFVPFSLEQVTNDTNNIFVERSIPSQGIFAADREVGIAFYNSTRNQRVTWTTGMFFDSISETLKERIDDNQGYRLSGRLTCLPYYDELSDGRYLVHTGVGILHTDDQDDRVRFRARPQIHEGPRLIDSGNLNADGYTTGNLEGAIVWGRVTLQGEAFLSSIHMNQGDSQSIQGAYLHLSYFLTGENRIFERFGQHGPQFGRNAPYSNFFVTPAGASLGAWEAKIRWSQLDLDPLQRGQYNDFTCGTNWYWSDRTRIMFDWIHPHTTRQALPFRSVDADILALRFDFNW